MRKYTICAITIGIIFLLASGIFMNTFNNGTNAEITKQSSSYWMQIAQNSWNYFSVGVGVDAVTGLPYSNINAPYYTDWDLASYIQAVLAAQKTGIIARTGTWGADDRINRVLTALETRPRMSNGLPYLWYRSDTNQVWAENMGEATATDAGKLFIALTALKTYDPTLKTRIDTLVYNTTNYEPRRHSVDILLPEYKQGTRIPNIYDYYVTRGFALFWPERFNAEADGMLDFIFSRSKTQYSGVTLPNAEILNDPLLMCLFEFQDNDLRIVALSREVYLAQEARYNSTGHYTAFSEGLSGFDGEKSYVYQWIILGDGRMWVTQAVTHLGFATDIDFTPIIFFTAAMGLHAIYETSYTQQMVNHLTSQMPDPAMGYNLGLDENDRILEVNAGFGNALVIEAASYAIGKCSANPTPTPIPTINPTLSPSPTPTATPTPTPTPSPTPSPTPTVNPTSTPTVTPTPTPTLTPTVTPTITPTPEPTETATPTPAPTPTIIPTVNPTKTSTPTPQPTTRPSVTPAPTSTNNPTAAPTPTVPELPVISLIILFATLPMIVKLKKKGIR